MGPKQSGKVTLPPTQSAHVDPFASPEFTEFQPAPQADQTEFKRDPLGGSRSDILPSEQAFDNHPLFRAGGGAIPGVKQDEPWMRRNALELLALHGIEEIANARSNEVFVVAALMAAGMSEIRGLELRDENATPVENECLLVVKKVRSLVRFLDVDVTGLPAPQAQWFSSLTRGREEKGKETSRGTLLDTSISTRFVHRGTYDREVNAQHKYNAVAFRSFYDRMTGLDPATFPLVHAWVTLDRGRIHHVGAPGQLPRERVPGLRATFNISIVEGAAHASCTERSLLYGMPSIYMAYFQQPFIKMRDVLPKVEAETEDLVLDLDVEIVPGEESEVLEDVDDGTGGLIA